MRIARITRTARAAAVGLAVVAASLAAAPAGAVTVQANAGVDALAVSDVSSVSDGTGLDPAASVLFDPGSLVSVGATRTAPGFIRQADAGAAFLTNLLDEAITVVITDLFTSQVFVTLDAAGEAGRGEASFTIRRGATVLDGSFDSVRLTTGDCDAFPCDQEDVDSGGFAFALDLAPSETARLDYDAYALAVAPVPVPASLGLSLAGLGALLAMRGRRRTAA